MKKIVALGAAGVLTFVMGTSVFAASSAMSPARGYATGRLVGHHVEHFGGHFNHVGMPGCSLSNQFCQTSAGYSVGDRVTEAPAPTPAAAPTGGRQTVSGQTYTQEDSGGYVSSGSYESGSYGSGSQGYGGGNSGNYGYGNCWGNGGGHHSGGHGRGCHW